MEHIILKFSDIIRNYEILSYNSDYDKVFFDANIFFINNSILACKDVMIFLENDLVKRKYSFHWMDNNHKLLVRWDNANHHKNIITYPFHKHIGKENIIEPANEISLFEVLSYISQILKNN